MIHIGPLDIAAFVWLLACMIGYPLITRRGLLAGRGLSTAIQRQRVQWIKSMSERENRIIDIQLLANLANGNAFFASTSVIVIGGLAAVLGASAEWQVMLSKLPYAAESSPLLWKLKTLFLMALFVMAFFKFAWAFRLTHYTAIMIGSTPEISEGTAAACRDHAERTARLAGIAAEHANAGLRAYYFAIAGIAWYLHPVLLMLSVTYVVLVLYRREYRSRALRAIRGS
ncbi:MAG: DUF599 domain-containing protein [Hyphomicrobiaceae bacterium]